MIWPVIRKYESLPFEYGTTDCCRFVGECIRAVKGENPADAFLYASESSAERLIASYGGLQGLLRAVLGDPVSGVEEYGVGLVSVRGEPVAGFVWKDKLILRTKKGLVDWPVSRAEYVWAI